MTTIQIVIFSAGILAVGAYCNIVEDLLYRNIDRVIAVAKDVKKLVEKERDCRWKLEKEVKLLERILNETMVMASELKEEIIELKEFTGMDKKEKVEEAAQNLLAEGNG